MNWLKVSKTCCCLFTGLAAATIKATELYVEKGMCRLCIEGLTAGCVALQLTDTGPGAEEGLCSQLLGKRGCFQQLLSLSINLSRKAAHTPSWGCLVLLAEHSLELVDITGGLIRPCLQSTLSSLEGGLLIIVLARSKWENRQGNNINFVRGTKKQSPFGSYSCLK